MEVLRARHVGRCGEDTFFSVLLGYDIATAKTLAERLRKNIQDYSWSTLAVSLRVTCSMGLAQLREKESAQDLVVRASIGLNKAKDAGRNKVGIGPNFLRRNQSRDLKTYYS